MSTWVLQAKPVQISMKQLDTTTPSLVAQKLESRRTLGNTGRHTLPVTVMSGLSKAEGRSWYKLEEEDWVSCAHVTPSICSTCSHSGAESQMDEGGHWTDRLIAPLGVSILQINAH